MKRFSQYLSGLQGLNFFYLWPTYAQNLAYLCANLGLLMRE